MRTWQQNRARSDYEFWNGSQLMLQNHVTKWRSRTDRKIHRWSLKNAINQRKFSRNNGRDSLEENAQLYSWETKIFCKNFPSVTTSVLKRNILQGGFFVGTVQMIVMFQVGFDFSDCSSLQCRSLLLPGEESHCC